MITSSNSSNILWNMALRFVQLNGNATSECLSVQVVSFDKENFHYLFEEWKMVDTVNPSERREVYDDNAICCYPVENIQDATEYLVSRYTSLSSDAATELLKNLLTSYTLLQVTRFALS